MKYFKGRSIIFDAPVEVYRCLNRKGKVFSIRQYGKVVAHTDELELKDCEFIVNESGKKRCQITKERNVHAFIRGTIAQVPDELTRFFLVRYNPYSESGFVTQQFERYGQYLVGEDHPVTSAKYAIIKDGTVVATNQIIKQGLQLQTTAAKTHESN